MINCERVLGHVRVVNAIAVDGFALRPILNRLQVLAQAVRKHLGAGPRAQLRLIGRRRPLACMKVLRRHLEAQQAALDASVEQRVRATRIDADGLRERRIAGQHCSLPSLELRAQPFSERSIKHLQLLLVADALAVRRIRCEQPGRRFADAHQQRQLAALDVHVIPQPRALHILIGRADGVRIAVVTAQGDASAGAGLAPCARFFHQRAPEFAIVSAPTNESEVAAHRPGRDIERDERSFEHERTRAAHRVDEVAAARRDRRPAAAQQHRRRQILLERRSHAARPIRATMQTVAREVETQRRTLTIEAHIDAYVGLVKLNRRTLARACAYLIDDRIFRLQRAEMRVCDAARGAAEFDRHRSRRREVFAPVDGRGARVQFLRRRGRKRRERQQHAACGARPETCAVGGLQRAFELYAEPEFARIRRAAVAQLGGGQVGDARRTRGKELHGRVRLEQPQRTQRSQNQTG